MQAVTVHGTKRTFRSIGPKQDLSLFRTRRHSAPQFAHGWPIGAPIDTFGHDGLRRCAIVERGSGAKAAMTGQWKLPPLELEKSEG
jgi:hypothetical protein